MDTTYLTIPDLRARFEAARGGTSLPEPATAQITVSPTSPEDKRTDADVAASPRAQPDA